jgi:hypothetical protein
VVAVLIAIALFAVQPPSARAGVQVIDRQPLVVRGTGFEPNERVLVVAAAGRSGDRRVLANRSGVFVVTFPFGVPRCTRFWIRASGNKGSQARSLLRVSLACERST